MPTCPKCRATFRTLPGEEQDHFCPHCGYDPELHDPPRCPTCGSEMMDVSGRWECEDCEADEAADRTRDRDDDEPRSKTEAYVQAHKARVVRDTRGLS